MLKGKEYIRHLFFIFKLKFSVGVLRDTLEFMWNGSKELRINRKKFKFSEPCGKR